MDIKVLGPGCPKCRQTEKVVKEAVAESGVAADVEKVTEVMKIAGYGVFGTPAVVVDGEVKSVGKGTTFGHNLVGIDEIKAGLLPEIMRIVSVAGLKECGPNGIGII